MSSNIQLGDIVAWEVPFGRFDKSHVQCIGEVIRTPDSLSRSYDIEFLDNQKNQKFKKKYITISEHHWMKFEVLTEDQVIEWMLKHG